MLLLIKYFDAEMLTIIAMLRTSTGVISGPASTKSARA
jgi:hypothetical protein